MASTQFGGCTLFTAWDPSPEILRRAYAAKVTRVLVETTEQNLERWPRLVACSPRPFLGCWDPDARGTCFPGASTWLAQVEGWPVPRWPTPAVPHLGIVTTLPSLQMSEFSRYTWLTECYQGSDPSATPLNMEFQAHQSGYPKGRITRPVCGVFDDYPLSAYAEELARFPHGFGVYLAEEMTDADWQTLERLIASRG